MVSRVRRSARINLSAFIALRDRTLIAAASQIVQFTGGNRRTNTLKGNARRVCAIAHDQRRNCRNNASNQDEGKYVAYGTRMEWPEALWLARTPPQPSHD